MKRVIFRADAGIAIGSGHITRSLALADAFLEKKCSIGLAATQETFETVKSLSGAVFERLVLPDRPENEAFMLAQRWPQGADVLVVDHYWRDASFEKACRPWASRILVVDDLANRTHEADVLVDGGIASREPYRKLVPHHCEVLGGARFAIVHPDFFRARKIALPRRDGRAVQRVLVSFGQIDRINATGLTLEALQSIGFDGFIDIAIGSVSPHLEVIKQKLDPRKVLHLDSMHMAELMTSADLAVGAGGVTSWERCCVGLPTALMTIADNQLGVARLQIEAGAAAKVGRAESTDVEKLGSVLDELLKNSDKRRQMSASASALVDGEGAHRIVEYLLQ
jgi:UDP-2,4-diacetamido-2,4,6-trideoxy-beta-L-altropyranose hydrolase